MIHAIWICVADAAAEDKRNQQQLPTTAVSGHPPAGAYIVQQPPYPVPGPGYAPGYGQPPAGYAPPQMGPGGVAPGYPVGKS
jgi:hypothetical protein